MKKIMIEGMMCEHCANAVKNALEELGGTNVSVNLDEGYAEVEINASDDEIISKISEEDFEVTSIE
ncbi:MAG: heavy-metal-associated domain-containing protein [Oscillospiraceae bacterium]|nr:heavy-metal-associated domain-containing protein [Oscillospiraceae bacterium]